MLQNPCTINCVNSDTLLLLSIRSIQMMDICMYVSRSVLYSDGLGTSNRSLQGYKPDAQSAVAWAERSDGVTPINVSMHAIQNIVVDV